MTPQRKNRMNLSVLKMCADWTMLILWPTHPIVPNCFYFCAPNIRHNYCLEHLSINIFLILWYINSFCSVLLDNLHIGHLYVYKWLGIIEQARAVSGNLTYLSRGACAVRRPRDVRHAVYGDWLFTFSWWIIFATFFVRRRKYLVYLMPDVITDVLWTRSILTLFRNIFIFNCLIKPKNYQTKIVEVEPWGNWVLDLNNKFLLYQENRLHRLYVMHNWVCICLLATH
jgi:hypothetical protein